MALPGKTGNNKLLKLKEWVTVQEAARHLSIYCDGEINEADVLRFALDGHLKLSVYIRCTIAKCCIATNADAAGLQEEIQIYDNVPWRGMILKPGDKTCMLDGIYDLPLIGADKADVEYKWRKLIGNPTQKYITLLGTFVTGENGQIYQIQKGYFNGPEKNSVNGEIIFKPNSLTRECMPAGELPEDSLLVVRKSALHELKDSFAVKELEELSVTEGSEKEKQPSNNAKSDLFKILDPTHPWHSEYLALAVNCWLELYANREGNKNDNAFKTPGGNTKLIGDWLKKKNRDILETTEEHIRVIINPNKRGGPQKTS